MLLECIGISATNQISSIFHPRKSRRKLSSFDKINCQGPSSHQKKPVPPMKKFATHQKLPKKFSTHPTKTTGNATISRLHTAVIPAFCIQQGDIANRERYVRARETPRVEWLGDPHAHSRPSCAVAWCSGFVLAWLRCSVERTGSTIRTLYLDAAPRFGS